jgi:hypothetical protein
MGDLGIERHAGLRVRGGSARARGRRGEQSLGLVAARSPSLELQRRALHYTASAARKKRVQADVNEVLDLARLPVSRTLVDSQEIRHVSESSSLYKVLEPK